MIIYILLPYLISWWSMLSSPYQSWQQYESHRVAFHTPYKVSTIIYLYKSFPPQMTSLDSKLPAASLAGESQLAMPAAAMLLSVFPGLLLGDVHFGKLPAAFDVSQLRLSWQAKHMDGASTSKMCHIWLSRVNSQRWSIQKHIYLINNTYNTSHVTL